SRDRRGHRLGDNRRVDDRHRLRGGGNRGGARARPGARLDRPATRRGGASHPHRLRRLGIRRVVGHLLLRDRPHPDLRQPVLEPSGRRLIGGIRAAPPRSAVMLIDWFTVVAQIVNFTILVLALKFLLYDRVVDVMERRRTAIAEREREAEERIEAAEAQLEQLRRDRQELDELREEMLAEARREAGERRRELLRQAREEVEEQAELWRESLRRQHDRLLSDIQRLTGEKVVAVSRRMLADMAGMSLEEAMLTAFIDRIGRLPEEERDAIAAEVQQDDGPIVVRTSFEPPDELRQSVDKALSDLVDAERPIRWERDEELICGVSVQTGARTLGWSVATYLTELENDFAELVSKRISAGGAQS